MVGKPATNGPAGHFGSYAPSYAVDNIIGGSEDRGFQYAATGVATACFTSDTYRSEPWLMLDMGRPLHLYHIRLYGRIDWALGAWLTGLLVYWSNSSTTWRNPSESSLIWDYADAMLDRGTWVVPMNDIDTTTHTHVAPIARYLWLVLPGTDRILDICEALISACPPG